MKYPSKAAHIRALLLKGVVDFNEVARTVDCSYTQVYQQWRAFTRPQRNKALIAATSRGGATPYVKGSRVVHHRQVDKSLYGVVQGSNRHTTSVRFGTQRVPAQLPTRDLIRAPGGPFNAEGRDTDRSDQGHVRSQRQQGGKNPAARRQGTPTT